MTITLIELVAWVFWPGLYSILLFLPFYLAWQLRLYFWPLVDRSDLDFANECFRLRRIEYEGGEEFERTGMLERQRISLVCAVRSLLRVGPIQLAICLVGATVAFVVSKVVSSYFELQVVSLVVPVYRSYLAATAFLLIGVLASIPFIGILQLLAFCKIEKRTWSYTLFTFRYVACMSTISSVVLVLALVFCLIDKWVFLAHQRTLLFVLYSLSFSFVPLLFSGLVLAVEFLLRGKVHANQDYLFLSQSNIKTSSISAKSDYELQKLIDAADTYRETEIAQWMREELLRRSDSLVPLEDLSVC